MSLEDAETIARMRVFAHPVRLRMISRLSAHALSAAELGRELGISQATASYHLRKLAQAGFVDLVEERVVRGGRERRYRYDPDPRRTIDPESRHDFVLAATAEVRRRIEFADHSKPAGGTDAEVWVTPEVWTETLERVRDAMVTLHREALAPESREAVPVSATTFLFALNPEASDPSGSPQEPDSVDRDKT